MRASLLRTAAAALAALGLVACSRSEQRLEQGEAPPPVASSTPGACSGGGGQLSDEEARGYMPRVSGDYCLDPNGDARTFGQGAKNSLDEVCTQLFDGECEVYKAFGLSRVVTLRYVDGTGSPGEISVNVSRFSRKEGAYGFFTKRVVAGGDPAEASVRPLEAGGAGALGAGVAYVWRGEYVAELRYNNERESPDQLRASSERLLPVLGKALGEKLPGSPAPLAAIAALPSAERLPLGLDYEARDALEVSGAGPGALGYYRSGDQRYLGLVMLRSDEDAAKDVLRVFKKLPGAKPLEGQPLEGVRFTLQDGEGPKREWVLVRKGSALCAVGDDDSSASAQQHPLSLADKLGKLTSWLAGLEAGASAPKAGPPGAAAASATP